ncbi:MAG: hypothetical protein WD766_13640 [Gemmatimonadota bacterium]
MSRTYAPLLAALVLALSSPAGAQSLDLTVDDVGISIGDSPRAVGLRLNFRDRVLEEVVGVNVTIWTPYEFTGHVNGVAVGLPLTGARRIDGIGVGIFGLGTYEDMNGIFAAPVGLGAGGSLQGIALSGIGTGAGGDLKGIGLGGIGLGIGGDAGGIVAGGAGLGIGGDLSGVGIGGVGIGLGGALVGAGVGGIGLGIGGSVVGLAAGGLGVSAYNDVRGRQNGLTIGIFNYARELNGVQLGLLNYARNKPPGTRLLPIINYARVR